MFGFYSNKVKHPYEIRTYHLEVANFNNEIFCPESSKLLGTKKTPNWGVRYSLDHLKGSDCLDSWRYKNNGK